MSQSFGHATDHPPVLRAASFPFLRRLVLHDIGVFLLFDLLCLSTASLPNVTELLCFDAWEEDEYILASESDPRIVNSLAPQIRHLLLHAGPSDRLPSFLRPFLAAASSLLTLPFSDLNKPLEVIYAEFLPQRLKVLAIRSGCRSDLGEGSNLAFALDAVDRLPSLQLLKWSDGGMEPGLGKVEKACAAKGVVLVTPVETEVWPPGLHWTEQRRVFNMGRRDELGQ